MTITSLFYLIEKLPFFLNGVGLKKMVLVSGTNGNEAYIGDGSTNSCNGFQDKCNNKETTLEIPSKIDETYIYEIKQFAFDCCPYIEVLILHEPLRSIGYLTFHCCTKLVHVTIPKTVTILDVSCFDDCHGLQRVDFAADSKIEEIRSRAFDTCDKLEYIRIPSSVKVIGERAFSEIVAHLIIHYCGKKKFEDTKTPFYSTNKYSIIVPKGGVSTFLGTKTIKGLATCDVSNIVHTCNVKQQIYSHIFTMILLIS